MQASQVAAIDAKVNFKNDIEAAIQLNAAATNSTDILELKREKLRQFAYHSKGPQTLQQWATREIQELFNRFGMLSSPNDQIKVYEDVSKKLKLIQEKKFTIAHRAQMKSLNL